MRVALEPAPAERQAEMHPPDAGGDVEILRRHVLAIHGDIAEIALQPLAALTGGGARVVKEVLDRFAGERPLNMSVAETASGEGTLDRMIEIGKELRDSDGSDVIVMGCAGMARHRAPLEAALGIPVIDPTQAAVAMALGAVQFAAG